MFSSSKQTPRFQHSRQTSLTSKKDSISISSNESNNLIIDNVQTPVKVTILPQFLTCNDKRVISLIGCLPLLIQDLLSKYQYDEISGSLDYLSGYANIIIKNTCYIWNYQKNSNDVRTFSLPNSKKCFLHFVPMSMTNIYNIGLIVCSSEGEIRYWNDISINSSNYTSCAIPLNNDKGKCLEKCEPNSFLYGTENGQVFLVNIMNLRGISELIYVPIARSVGLLRRMGSLFFSENQNKKKIVKVISQPEINNQREIYIITSQNVQIWSFEKNSQEKLINEKSISNLLNELFIPMNDKGNFEEYDPEIRILDCDITRENHLLFLVSYKLNQEPQNEIDNEDMMKEDIEEQYSFALIFVEINQNDIEVTNVKLIEKTVKNKNYEAKLVLPNRGPVICVLFENTIVITTTGKNIAYKEIFSMNEKIVGYGVDRSKIWNPEADVTESIHLLCYGKKIINIDISIENIYYETQSDLINSKKYELYSALEQVVFFDNEKNPIYFELPLSSSSDLDDVTKQLSDDILNSKSEFLPPVIDLKTYLSEKLLRLNKIMSFLKDQKRIDELSLPTRLKLCWNAEKVAAAIELWKYTNSIIGKKQPYTNIINHIISSYYTSENKIPERDDYIRYFFQNYISDIHKLIEHLPNPQTENDQIEINKIILTIVKSAYEYRENNMQLYNLSEDSITNIEPWCATETILNTFQINFEKTESCINNKVYSSITDLKENSINGNNENKKILEDQLVKLVSITLEIFTERIAFVKKTEFSAALKTLQDEYLEKLSSFIRPIAKINKKQIAIKLAEKYQDFDTLVELSINDSEKRNKYIDQYGNKYADKLYDKFQLNGQYKILMEQDNKYNVILENYFNKKDIPLISWINDIKLKKYDNIYKKLIKTGGITKQSQRRQQLSISKLALLASKKNMISEEKKDEYINNLQKVTFELRFVNMLNIYKEKLINSYKDNVMYEKLSEQEQNNVENIVKSYYEDESLTYKNEYSAFLDIQKKYSKEILEDNLISIEEFIDFLTFEGLLLEGTNSIDNFIYSIEFYRYLEEEIQEEDRECILQCLWRRAVINTKWDKIKKDLGDEQIHSLIENTTLFKLIFHLKSENLIRLIRKPHECHEIPNIDRKYPWASEDEMLSINEDYKKENQKLGFYISHFDLKEIFDQIVNSI